MQYIVIRHHFSNYASPIVLKTGDTVKIGNEYTGTENWPNWIFCLHEQTLRKGWIPKQILEIRNKRGVVKEDYTAKELNISVGEKVEGERILNGWIWARNMRNEAGWVPLVNLKKLSMDDFA